MNARPRFPYADQDETLITLSRWQRLGLEAAMAKLLPDAPEAGEELDDDAAPDAPEPYVLTEDQERINYHFEEDW